MTDIRIAICITCNSLYTDVNICISLLILYRIAHLRRLILVKINKIFISLWYKIKLYAVYSVPLNYCNFFQQFLLQLFLSMCMPNNYLYWIYI